MVNAVIRYVFIVLGLVVLWASTSRTAMQYITDKRDIKNRWWGLDELDHGDLASLSYLQFVPKFAPDKEPEHAKRPEYSGQKNTALYLDGDSYSRRLADTCFAGVAEFHLIDRNHEARFHLDTTKRNILIIEISERYLRPYFGDLKIFNELVDTGETPKAIGYFRVKQQKHVRLASVSEDIGIDCFFNKFINQNLQCNLFNYQFIMPMFGSKAAINYYLFDRASGDVVISRDRNFLFLKETVSLTDEGSSYIPVSDEVVNHLVDNFNSIYSHYKAAGFREVYLSVIPNSATINQPEGDNNLIPRLQSHPAFTMQVIDAYATFKKSTDVLYFTGDTHWNNKGRQLWLDLVNEKLVN